MPDADFIPLPSDPRDLTRERVLSCGIDPAPLLEAYVRLATQPQRTPSPEALHEKAAANHA